VSTNLIEWLQRRGEPAYAVLDAARDGIVLATLLRSGVDHASLYEGHEGASLCDVAPYLVPLRLDSPLLALIRGDWWGRAFGILLTSLARPADVRACLQRMLVVRLESDRKAYFRFYDPRVLRTFMPIATRGQVSSLFGGGDVSAYVCEASDPARMCVFTESADGTVGVLETEMVRAGVADARAL
jgi:hypothetical protein